MARLRRQQRLRAREPGAEAAAVLESRVSNKAFRRSNLPCQFAARLWARTGPGPLNAARRGGAGRGRRYITAQLRSRGGIAAKRPRGWPEKIEADSNEIRAVLFFFLGSPPKAQVQPQLSERIEAPAHPTRSELRHRSTRNPARAADSGHGFVPTARHTTGAQVECGSACVRACRLPGAGAGDRIARNHASALGCFVSLIFKKRLLFRQKNKKGRKASSRAWRCMRALSHRLSVPT